MTYSVLKVPLNPNQPTNPAVTLTNIVSAVEIAFACVVHLTGIWHRY